MDDVERNQIEKDPKKQQQRKQQIHEKIGQMIEVHVKMFEYVERILNFQTNKKMVASGLDLRIETCIFKFQSIFPQDQVNWRRFSIVNNPDNR